MEHFKFSINAVLTSLSIQFMPLFAVYPILKLNRDTSLRLVRVNSRISKLPPRKNVNARFIMISLCLCLHLSLVQKPLLLPIRSLPKRNLAFIESRR